MSVVIQGSGPTQLRTYLFPDANATMLTNLTTSITLANLILNGAGRLNVQAAATGIAIDITGRASDGAGYLQLFRSDGTTLEGGFRGGNGFVSFFGPAGNDVLTITNPGMACTGTVSGTDFFSSGNNGYQVAAGAFVYWTGRFSLNSPALSQLNVTNHLSSVGVGFDVATDGTLKIRTRAQTGDGQLSAASVRGNVVAFASLPATPVEGMLVAVSDSNTAVWGATIAGGGANHVLASYNGTNWTVAGK